MPHSNTINGAADGDDDYEDEDDDDEEEDEEEDDDEEDYYDACNDDGDGDGNGDGDDDDRGGSCNRVESCCSLLRDSVHCLQLATFLSTTSVFSLDRKKPQDRYR